MDNANGYRLERLIAFLLGLLFFLPFIAQAEENATGRRNRGLSQAETFLGLTSHPDKSWSLETIRMRVDGSRVSAAGEVFNGAFLGGPRLQAGNVAAASPASFAYGPREGATFRFGAARFTLRYHCDSAVDPEGMIACQLMLQSGEKMQVLGSALFWADNKGPARGGMSPRVFFAGDLDRDGRLDLFLDMPRHPDDWHPALLLSTATPDPNELLAPAVGHTAWAGCP